MEKGKPKDALGLRVTALMTKDKLNATVRAQTCIYLEEEGKLS